MFGHKADPSLIYRYGAKTPIEHCDVVDAQIRAAHRYYNQLVEIELRRREQATELVRSLSPELDTLTEWREELSETIDSVRAEIKAANQRARRKTTTKAQRDQVKALRKQRKAVTELWREAKAAAYDSPDAKAGLAAIDEAANESRRQARAACGVYWGTYLAIEQSIPKTSAPPTFHRWTGDGRVVVQLQGGMSAAEAFACRDNRFRIEPVPEEAWDRGQPKRLQRTRAWVRVDSDGRDPVWAVVPITLHRPFPEDCRIKWVYLIRRKVASKDKWSLCLVLSRVEGWQKTDLGASGSVGIDLGWRLVAEGLRVAYWAGDDGESGSVVLPMRDVGRWQKARDLQSIRATNFDAIVLRLAGWLAGRELPDWLTERTKTLRQWRSQGRLAAVVIQWRAERFDGDAEIFAEVEAWRKQDKHLWEWEHNQRRKAIAWRENVYRQFAAMLSRRYRVVCLEATDWRHFMRKVAAEEDGQGGAGAQRYLRIASPGQLSRLLAERFAEVVRVDPKHTTQRCHVCGELAQFDAATSLHTKCRHCGAEWDQDYNAARNLLGAASGPVPQETP